MTKAVKVPFLGVNDQDCKVCSIYNSSGTSVNKGDLLFTLETMKASVDIEAEEEGYFYYIIQEESIVSFGDVIAVISENEINDVEETLRKLNELSGKVSVTQEKTITKKAEILIKKNNLDIRIIQEKYKDSLITEEVILKFINDQETNNFSSGVTDIERIGIIGGGNAASIVIDSLLRIPNKNPVCIFERNPYFHNKLILGIPVVGTIDLLDKYFEEGLINSVVIAFNRNLSERAEVFNEIKSKGIPFCNVVDPTANIRSEVKIGTGNIILGNVYVGTCTKIGDNNFISSNVCLEHGNVLGSHCGFGPGVFTSGLVKIGDRVRFGTGIFIEPSVEIGDDCIISSGSVIRASIPEKSVVRIKYNLDIRKNE